MICPSAISVTEIDEYFIWILEKNTKNVGSLRWKWKL